MNQPGHRAPTTLRWPGIPTHPLEINMSTEYEVHTEDLTGDVISDSRKTLPAAIALAQHYRDEYGMRAHVWQRENDDEWAPVWPKRRWWLPWTWTDYPF